MNNIQELIERLDAIKALVPEIGMANCEAPIDDAITELESMQAPLPNNIQELIDRPLRNAIDHIQHECYNDALSSIHEAIAALESMQQRIEKLEQQPCSACPYMDEIPPAPAQVIEDLQNRIEELRAGK